jgi:hypothetical protein
MKRIYKYKLENASTQRIPMPEGAQILCAQVQNGGICIWALVDPDAPGKQERTIHVYGTGWDIGRTELLRHIDTIQFENGALIFHVFEVM